MTTGLKAALSLFLVYHLAAVLILANPDSILARDTETFFRPYADTLAFNTPWRFFAPNPGKHRAIEVETINADGTTGLHSWPPPTRRGLMTELYNRRFYHSVMVTATADRLENFFVPWVCRLFPGAESISVQVNLREIPNIYQARLKKRAFSEMTQEQDFPPQDFPCQREEEL